MEFPASLRYTKEHEWIRVEGDQAYVGITDYAQQELGDVVFIELPEAGGEVRYMEPFGVVESVKAVSDLFSPITGAIKQVNEELFNRPELVNSDPYGQGWMLLVAVGDASQLDTLMTAEQYEAYLRQVREG
jgi:glycine cleavage system H protein